MPGTILNYLKPMSNYWLVKQEPSAYGWEQFCRDGRTEWEGVRNYQARNHLRGMKVGDLVLYYHSVEGKEVVGVARVSKEYFPDRSARSGDWSAVELVPEMALRRKLGLAEIKSDNILCDMALVRQSRLSVMSIEKQQFERVLEVTGTKFETGGGLE